MSKQHGYTSSENDVNALAWAQHATNKRSHSEVDEEGNQPAAPGMHSKKLLIHERVSEAGRDDV